MYKICKTEQSSHRQEQITTAFLSLLASQSYEDISISALCEKAQIPRKSFYRYFDCKWDVFVLAVDLLIIEYGTWVNPQSPKDAPATPEKEIEKLFAFFLQKKYFLDLIKRDHLSALFIQRIVEQSLSERLGVHFVVANSSPSQVRLSMLFSISGLFSLLWDWHQRGCRESPKEMADIVCPMLTGPLFYRVDKQTDEISTNFSL